eukprot:1160588-Pelagomonas_calceolata.AAC.5
MKCTASVLTTTGTMPANKLAFSTLSVRSQAANICLCFLPQESHEPFTRLVTKKLQALCTSVSATSSYDTPPQDQPEPPRIMHSHFIL